MKKSACTHSHLGVLIFLSFLSFSCATGPKVTSNSDGATKPQTRTETKAVAILLPDLLANPTKNVDLSLAEDWKNLVAERYSERYSEKQSEKSSSRAFSNPATASNIDGACGQNSELKSNRFCEAWQALPARPTGGGKEPMTRGQIKALQKEIRQGKFENSQDLSINQALRLIGDFSKQDLLKLSNALMPACSSENLQLATAAQLEDFFPETNIVNQTEDLLKQIGSCGESSTHLRSLYRWAILKIWQGDCSQNTMDGLEKVATGESVKYLSSRAHFWLNRCRAKQPTRDIASDYLKEFPLSFYSVQMAKDSDISMPEEILVAEEPVVQRHGSTEMERQILILEYLIYSENIGLAQTWANRLTTLLAKEDGGNAATSGGEAILPSQRLYLGVLLHHLGRNVLNFRNISKAIAQDPKMRSKTVVKLFYPTAFVEEIEREAKRRELDQNLVLAIIRQESGFDPNARSAANAIGLMQLIPPTAKKLRPGTRARDLFEPEINVALGTKYMAQLLRRFESKHHLALASYNAGVNKVEKWLKRYPTQDELLFVELMPYQETKDYVVNILRNKFWYEYLYEKKSPGQKGMAFERGGAIF